ncbi:MAG: hypothetical protein ABR878_18100 [Roseiarcus sp.]|jgi:hypothetical protein
MPLIRIGADSASSQSPIADSKAAKKFPSETGKIPFGVEREATTLPSKPI